MKEKQEEHDLQPNASPLNVEKLSAEIFGRRSGYVKATGMRPSYSKSSASSAPCDEQVKRLEERIKQLEEQTQQKAEEMAQQMAQQMEEQMAKRMEEQMAKRMEEHFSGMFGWMRRFPVGASGGSWLVPYAN